MFREIFRPCEKKWKRNRGFAHVRNAWKSKKILPLVVVCYAPLAVADARMKDRFARAVDIKGLRTSLGTWKPTPERPGPYWEILIRAPVWTDERYKTIRDAVSTARPLPEITASTQTALACLGPDPSEGRRWRVDVFKATPGEPVPEAALGRTVRLVVVDAEGPDVRAGGPIGRLFCSAGTKK